MFFYKKAIIVIIFIVSIFQINTLSAAASSNKNSIIMQQLIKAILAISEDVRYVAIYRNHKLISQTKQNLTNTSSSESDKYEELIVNPTVLTLVKQRGEIDCGGAKFVLVRYGNFYQLIIPIQGGHVSVCIESFTDPLKLLEPIQSVLKKAL